MEKVAPFEDEIEGIFIFDKTVSTIWQLPQDLVEPAYCIDTMGKRYRAG
jgi:hypothetical protein